MWVSSDRNGVRRYQKHPATHQQDRKRGGNWNAGSVGRTEVFHQRSPQIQAIHSSLLRERGQYFNKHLVSSHSWAARRYSVRTRHACIWLCLVSAASGCRYGRGYIRAGCAEHIKHATDVGERLALLR